MQNVYYTKRCNFVIIVDDVIFTIVVKHDCYFVASRYNSATTDNNVVTCMIKCLNCNTCPPNVIFFRVSAKNNLTDSIFLRPGPGVVQFLDLCDE